MRNRASNASSSLRKRPGRLAWATRPSGSTTRYRTSTPISRSRTGDQIRLEPMNHHSVSQPPKPARLLQVVAPVIGLRRTYIVVVRELAIGTKDALADLRRPVV